MDPAKHFGIRDLFIYNILAHTDPFIGNEHKTKNEKMATDMQQDHKHANLLEPLLGSSPCTTMEVVFSMNLL
jgi:hypothetical protein